MSQRCVCGSAVHPVIWWCFFICLCGLTLIQPFQVSAESYVAGFAGYGVSSQLSHIRGTGDIAGLTGSNLGLQNSPIYGLKVGHFLDDLKYFGAEAELYSATPFLKQQQFTLSGPGGTASATLPGGPSSRDDGSF